MTVHVESDANFAASEKDESATDYFRGVDKFSHTCVCDTFEQNKQSFLRVVDEWKGTFKSYMLSASAGDISTSYLFAILAKDDIKHFALESIVSQIEELKKQNMKVTTENLFNLLSKILAPKSKIQDCSTFYSLDDQNGLKHIFKPKKTKQLYSKAWIEFTKLKLPRFIHMQCLELIPIKVMANTIEPILFTDFFFKSYALGPPFNILALNGVFLLIVKHNLDYPEFFKQVYCLLTTDVYDLSNRDQFFTLLDTFLSSLHVPAYLVAAFVKRLSRLALTAPPDVCLIIITLVKNWMIRHPNLNVLIDNISDENMVRDPYDAEAKDPALSKAIESSLWEIKTLQSHYLLNVARKAMFINRPLDVMEDPFVQKSTEKIMSQHMKKTFDNDVPTAFVPPTSLFRNAFFDDCFVE